MTVVTKIGSLGPSEDLQGPQNIDFLVTPGVGARDAAYASKRDFKCPVANLETG